MQRSAALTIGSAVLVLRLALVDIGLRRAHGHAEHDLRGRLGALALVAGCLCILVGVLALQESRGCRPLAVLLGSRLADGGEQRPLVVSFCLFSDSPNARCSLPLGLESQRYSVAS